MNPNNGTPTEWPYMDKSGNTSTYLQGEFYEGGIDLSAFPGLSSAERLGLRRRRRRFELHRRRDVHALQRPDVLGDGPVHADRHRSVRHELHAGDREDHE